MSSKSPMVVLRDMANQAKQRIGWDKNTGNVNVGGQEYSPQQLKDMGGQLINDQWNLPTDVANQVIGNSPQGKRSAYESRYPQRSGAQEAQERQLAEMQQALTGMSDSYLTQQKAQLENAKNNQLSQLQMVYEQAIADGKISVRDAQEQFEEQKQSIEQQAYLDSQRTALYGQDMGIQNSQQMVGLMQGDNARKNGLINQNMTTRDKRVSDIKDRLNAIKKQKGLDESRVLSEYDNGLLRAQGEANQMYASNMFGLMSNNYFANRDQQFAQENMRLGDELQRGQMELQQQYTNQNMDKQFEYSLQQATHDSELAINRMNVQHGLDLDTMAKAFENDVRKMNIQYGHQASLQSQSHANAMARAKQNYALKVQAEEQAYQKQLQRDLKGLDPKSDEYKVIQGNYDRELKNNLTKIHINSVYEAMLGEGLSGAPSTPPKEPHKFQDPGMNFFTQYDKKKSIYDAQMDAINRKNNIINSVSDYMPWNN